MNPKERTLLGRHTPSHQRDRGRDETKGLVRDLQSLIISEANTLSPVKDHSEAITLHSGTLGRVDNLLRKGEMRDDFVRTAIEVEITRRQSESEAEK